MLMLLDASQKPAPARQIEALAAGLRERFGARDVLLVIDAIQPWAKGLGEGSEYDLLQDGLRELVGVTSALRAPCLVLSHRNRASTKEKQATAGMTAAKGTADFEHLAESVLHLAWEKDAAEADERSITAFLAKNRRGPGGFSLTLHFDTDTQSIRDGSMPRRWPPGGRRG